MAEQIGCFKCGHFKWIYEERAVTGASRPRKMRFIVCALPECRHIQAVYDGEIADLTYEKLLGLCSAVKKIGEKVGVSITEI